MRFDTLLIANRGEIALRVIRTARRMGLRTVAVYSDADAQSPHVQAAHLAVHIGPSAADQSYRNVAAIIDACRRSGAQAIHPGYGFLSENAEFAQAVVDAGLVFVGPTSKVITLMGNKAQAKLTMQAAGVPTVPGEQGCTSVAQILAAAEKIGFPVILKAAAGGGGRGMRVVREPAGLPEMFRQAHSEAASAFGSDEIIIERAIEQGRHIEVQVLCDEHGNCLHLGERDCSTQRRFQKLIEEAPSPAVNAELRAAMGDVARNACRAIGYTGVGTLEFLLDADKRHFYFMEMNTRLQVEHGVTELVTGLDLVEQQLRVAQGEALAFGQDDVAMRGHAIEVRVCAEDPWQGYLPQVGTLGLWQPPEGIRIDAALHSGSAITPFYDSMVAKLLAHADTREACALKLQRACEDTTALGVRTNLGFLQRCLAHPRFIAGEVTTDFLGKQDLASAEWAHAPSPHAQAAAALLLGGAAGSLKTPALASDRREGRSFWMRDVTSHTAATLHECTATRGDAPDQLHLQCREGHPPSRQKPQAHQTHQAPDATDATTPSWRVDNLLGGADMGANGGTLSFALDGLWRRLHWHRDHDGRIWIQDHANSHVFERVVDFSSAGDADGKGGVLKAPMSARVIAVFVEAGQMVAKDDPLVVLESMKMEMPMLAPCAGKVEKLSVATGAQLNAGQLILEVAEHGDANDTKATA
ncbi:acetyl/propionyl/methylcrotonyl-CoA carboxylase subunit alpha [Diaphorobacter caeni]|uniref:acetyl/propionyl/methylcrotonyl-CoA carboxylase subunit alpha n=1 Tax=Diaphorobacter caeni TaxID=2784387 RepID=UPI00188E98B3|nr:biotin carboxylase N-terminal domain-containing protein [Diaphorobacter caeni]MBF5006253.1 ATP-grasp domain-containing protein [Diaphorobacter caeni]